MKNERFKIQNSYFGVCTIALYVKNMRMGTELDGIVMDE